jgi:hypothetical protein
MHFFSHLQPLALGNFKYSTLNFLVHYEGSDFHPPWEQEIAFGVRVRNGRLPFFGVGFFSPRRRGIGSGVTRTVPPALLCRAFAVSARNEWRSCFVEWSFDKDWSYSRNFLYHNWCLEER